MILRTAEEVVHYFCAECGEEIDKFEYKYCPHCGHYLNKPESIGIVARSSQPCMFTYYKYGLFEHDNRILFKPKSTALTDAYDILTGEKVSDISMDSEIYTISVDIK